MPTIKDIARIVGVSPTTVSNVLHGKHQRVSAETVERIRVAIEQRAMCPTCPRARWSATLHASLGSSTIWCRWRAAGFFQDPFHSVLLSGIEQTLRKNDYFLMVRTVDSVEELHSLLSNWNIDGLILTGIFPRELYKSLRGQKKPFVLIDSYIEDEHSLQIRLEDEKGGYIATRYLLERGHREILFCCPRMEKEGVIRERFSGYSRALSEYGLPVQAENIYESSFPLRTAWRWGAGLPRGPTIPPFLPPPIFWPRSFQPG